MAVHIFLDLSFPLESSKEHNLKHLEFLKGNLLSLRHVDLFRHPMTYICFHSTTRHHAQKLICLWGVDSLGRPECGGPLSGITALTVRDRGSKLLCSEGHIGRSNALSAPSRAPVGTVCYNFHHWNQCLCSDVVPTLITNSSSLIGLVATKSYACLEVLVKCKLNVNVYVYSLISHRVQQTSQFTPLVLELFLVRSHLLWGDFSAFSAAIAIHNSSLFVPPGTHHCWVDRGGMICKACPTPLHMADSMTRAPAVTHPSTNRARRCLTSVIWRELVTIRPCATKLAGIEFYWQCLWCIWPCLVSD